MDLLRQLEIWERDEKWDKIIMRLEKIKPLGRSPEMNLLLSSAYLFTLSSKGDVDLTRDREVLNKTIEALSLCADELKDDSQWNANMGSALFHLHRYGEALPYLQIFIAMDGDQLDNRMKRQLDRWLATCKVFIPRPPFDETFSERVEKAWVLFEGQEAGFRRLLDQNPKGKKFIALEEKVDKIIKVALDNEFFHIEKKDDKYRLILTGSNSLMRLFEAEYFKEHAPENILQAWDIIVGEPHGTPTEVSLIDKDSIVNEAKIWVRENNGIFYIDAYSSKSVNLGAYLPIQLDPIFLKDVENRSQDILFEALFIGFLGEIVRFKFIHLSEILQSPFKEQYLRLFDLPNYLKEHGIDIQATSKSLLNLEVDYSFVPTESKEWRFYREDVISGKTMCMPMLTNFLNGNEYEINKLEADGATTGYIFYGLEHFKGENREEEITEFRKYLKKALSEKFGSDELKIIGEAHGIYKDYIDVILWNSNKVFDSLRVFLEGIPEISYSAFQVFRKSTTGLLLTGDKFFEEKFNGTVLQPADMLNPVGIDYPRVADIGTKKTE